MNGWGNLTPENIHEFAQEMASQIGMDESQKESLSSGVTKRVSKSRSRSDSSVSRILSPRDNKKSPRDTPSDHSNKSSPRVYSPRFFHVQENSMSFREKYPEKNNLKKTDITLSKMGFDKVTGGEVVVGEKVSISESKVPIQEKRASLNKEKMALKLSGKKERGFITKQKSKEVKSKKEIKKEKKEQKKEEQPLDNDKENDF